MLLPVLAILVVFGIITLWLFWLIFAIWAFAEIAYAGLVDNHVQVSEHNYPRIHNLAEEVRENLGLEREISIFVYEQSDFNAWMTRFFRRRAIFLQSEVLEAGVTDDEVRWLVGRFVGYLRLDQDAGWFGRLLRITEYSGIFTLLVLPYSRAKVYTGDRLGLAAIDGDIGSALSVMQKLFVGRQLGYSVNPLGIIDQRRRSKGRIFAFLSRLGSPFPSATARYVDLLAFARREYPARFADFDATTPGLPDDLDDISGERTTEGAPIRFIGIVIALYVAVMLTALWPSWLLPRLIDLADGSSSASDDYADDPWEDAFGVNDAEDAMEDEADAMADGAADAAEEGGEMADFGPNPMEDAARNMGRFGDNSAQPPGSVLGQPAQPIVYVTCITNNTGRTITYEMDYGDNQGWERYDQESDTTITHYTEFTDQPDIRFDYTLGDGTYVPREYWLRTTRTRDRSDCSDYAYRFTVENSEIDMVLTD